MVQKAFLFLLLATPVGLALTQETSIPTEVQMPGTQQNETFLDSVTLCAGCHAGYDPAIEMVHNWGGSMMAHAARDPLFWAATAIAEQDFPGAADLCIRCHSPKGWIENRSTPTDGSALQQGDADSVACDVCHKLANPDDSEHLGIQNYPFYANDEGMPKEGYYGSGMMVVYGEFPKLGPYSDPFAPHEALQSSFHRSPELCGTCHDVSNPVVGDLAHNNGAQKVLEPGTFSGVLGSPVETKAAFNNFPFQYGVIERTYSEHKASALASTRVSDYATLPANLRDGAIEKAYQDAIAADPSGDYADGTPRFFSCQSCHLPPVQGVGCVINGVPVRNDLPLHDLTGANTWVPDAIQYLDAGDKLVLGEDLTEAENEALEAGKARAAASLKRAAALEVDGNMLRVINLTGHKLISGYPEGRRMWIRIRWFDEYGDLLRDDGAYGAITAMVNGMPTQVRTILDLAGTNTRIYESQLGLTQQWAEQLVALGTATKPLSFDRVTGDVELTLAELAAMPKGSVAKSFHFVLNNTIVSDNRIPPYGFSYDAALERSALPAPETQYGDPGTGGTYEYWDELSLNPPAGAIRARIQLLYQTTSWEYIQFLYLANDGTIAHLASTGDHILEAWLNTGMSKPVVMATANWYAHQGNRLLPHEAPDRVVTRPAR